MMDLICNSTFYTANIFLRTAVYFDGLRTFCVCLSFITILNSCILLVLFSHFQNNLSITLFKMFQVLMENYYN